jgi:hypothetical protein
MGVRHPGSSADVIYPSLPWTRVTSAQPLLEFATQFVDLTKICNISGFHGGNYEEWRLLGCYAVWLL